MERYHHLLRVSPYSFQHEGIKFGKDHKYIMIGDEMGLGKTLQALALALEYQANTGAKVFIVAPSYLKRNWKAEIYKFSKDQKKTVTIVDKRNDFYSKNTPLDSDFYIVSYHMLRYASRIYSVCDFVICDESHYLKNHVSARTRIFENLLKVKKPEYLLLLTGTAIRNGIADLYSPMKLLGYADEGTNGIRIQSIYDNIFQFQEKFCYKKQVILKNGKKFNKYYGLRNKELLKTLLKNKYIKRKSAKVLDLPPIIYKDIFVDYVYRAGTTLDDAWKEYQKVNRMTEFIMKMKRKSSLAKVEFTAEYCTRLLGDGFHPLMIYTDHPESAHQIHKLIDGNGVVVEGATPMHLRDAYVKLFQDGKLNYICASIRAFNEGINLTKATNVIFNDLAWTPADNMQAVKRIHRIGQSERSLVHYILGSRVDKSITQILREKESIVKELEKDER